MVCCGILWYRIVTDSEVSLNLNTVTPLTVYCSLFLKPLNLSQPTSPFLFFTFETSWRKLRRTEPPTWHPWSTRNKSQPDSSLTAQHTSETLPDHSEWPAGLNYELSAKVCAPHGFPVQKKIKFLKFVAGHFFPQSFPFQLKRWKFSLWSMVRLHLTFIPVCFTWI